MFYCVLFVFLRADLFSFKFLLFLHYWTSWNFSICSFWLANFSPEKVLQKMLHNLKIVGLKIISTTKTFPFVSCILSLNMKPHSRGEAAVKFLENIEVIHHDYLLKFLATILLIKKENFPNFHASRKHFYSVIFWLATKITSLGVSSSNLNDKCSKIKRIKQCYRKHLASIVFFFFI